MSEDPIGFTAGDTNFYRYVFNRPVLTTDPDGKISQFAGAIILIGLGAVIITKAADWIAADEAKGTEGTIYKTRKQIDEWWEYIKKEAEKANQKAKKILKDCTTFNSSSGESK